MTLRCECGGAVELDGPGIYGEEYATEQYECVACGRTGSLLMGPDGESKSGCLTNS